MAITKVALKLQNKQKKTKLKLTITVGTYCYWQVSQSGSLLVLFLLSSQKSTFCP